MDSMNIFNDIENNVQLLKSNKIKLEQYEETSANGQLDKWILTKQNGNKYFWKAPSIIDGVEMYECEAECLASDLAEIFGIDNFVKYKMVYNVEEFVGYNKVCESEDFIKDNYFVTYAEILSDIAYYNGEEKYDKVISVNKSLQEQINNVLLFDIIIANRDRHLNNSAFITEKDNGSNIILFDNGDSFFSKLTDNGLKFALNTTFNYSKCRPFFNTVGKQLELIKFHSLNKVSFNDVSDLTAKYFSGIRLNTINKWLKISIEKVGLLK